MAPDRRGAARRGADVVVTGRVTDTGLTLGPIFHEFGWSPDDWDKVAAGTVAGHIIECGAQASGGNLLKGWRSVKGLANPGFPIVEASADGSFVVTKHPGTGGVVSVAVGDGAAGVRDGRPGQLHHARRRRRLHHHPARVQAGKDRVRVSGIRGGPRTPMLKVSIAYFYGYKAVGTLVYSWPEAYDKAQGRRPHPPAAAGGPRPRVRADPHRIRRRERHARPAERASRSRHPRGAAPDRRARAEERAPVERFTREIAPLVLTGPPSVTGFAGGRPAVEEVVAYWPALIDRREIEPHVRVEILEA